VSSTQGVHQKDQNNMDKINEEGYDKQIDEEV
jgi:hypothetical protein